MLFGIAYMPHSFVRSWEWFFLFLSIRIHCHRYRHNSMWLLQKLHFHGRTPVYLLFYRKNKMNSYIFRFSKFQFEGPIWTWFQCFYMNPMESYTSWKKKEKKKTIETRLLSRVHNKSYWITIINGKSKKKKTKKRKISHTHVSSHFTFRLRL